MRTISRRFILTTGASAGLLLSTPDWLKNATAQTPYTRYSATSPEGKAMLSLYARAVDIMMNKIPKGDPRNWDFQWYSHWIPGPQSPWSAVAKKKSDTIQSIYAGKPSNDPHRVLADLMWDDCQAHGDNPNQPNFFQEEFFLPWHRYFIYYFEHVIRGVLQNANFTLPYWNFLGGTAASRSIPEEFRNPSSPLYRSNRNSGVNTGAPIDSGTGRTPLNSDAFNEMQYIDSANGSIGFCPMLDNNPHGAVHVDVGNGTNMGRVPTAAGDPVFWLHHAEIDRLWESWNRLDRKNPSWPDRNFVFANAGGGMVTAPVAGANSPALLGYQYDNYYVPAGSATAVAAAPPLTTLAARPLEVRAIAANALSLGDGPVRTSLALPSPPLGGARTMQFAAPAGSRNLYLVLTDIMLNAEPGDVVYNVYVDLPEGANPTPNDPHYVGTVNFFHIMTGHDMTAVPGTLAHHSTVAFNVTEAVRKLQSVNGLSQQATVTLLPSGKPAADAKPVVGRVELLER
ncbi:MAG TPA: tyrosinase family protein [Pseudolabrys sp.]